MNACFASGGPDWLFAVVVGAGMAGVIGLATAFAPAPFFSAVADRPRHRWWDRGFALLASTPFIVAVLNGNGLPLSLCLWVFVPMAVITATSMLERPWRQAAAGRALPIPPGRTWTFALGCLGLATAATALLAMIVQGHPC